jgi:hypothetical protein
MPPSPVVCSAPARAAPRFSDSIAARPREPKLMAEMFTIDIGRNALARRRAPPTTFAAGNGTDGSGPTGSPGGAASGNATCSTIR